MMANETPHPGQFQKTGWQLNQPVAGRLTSVTSVTSVTTILIEHPTHISFIYSFIISISDIFTPTDLCYINNLNNKIYMNI